MRSWEEGGRSDGVAYLSTAPAQNTQRGGDNRRSDARDESGGGSPEGGNDRALRQGAWSCNGLRRLPAEYPGENRCRCLLRSGEARSDGLDSPQVDRADG